VTLEILHSYTVDLSILKRELERTICILTILAIPFHDRLWSFLDQKRSETSVNGWSRSHLKIERSIVKQLIFLKLLEALQIFKLTLCLVLERKGKWDTKYCDTKVSKSNYEIRCISFFFLEENLR